jgi:hypothetical protein
MLAMSFTYVVKKGDTLSAIAQRHGLKSWTEIYHFEENGPFRAKRPNPNLIYPGDEVKIPGDDPFAPPKPPDPVPPPPPPPDELPVSTQFVIHRMGSEPVIQGAEHQLFFHVTDMTNGRLAAYWLQPQGVAMTKLSPPERFTGVSRRFSPKGPHAVNKLECLAAYSSTEVVGKVTSRLTLFLPSGGITFDMPHHLIGPGGMLSASKDGQGSASTAIAGQFRFVKLL